MKIAFHTNQINLRGTEIALFDYAHFNEVYLQNKSIVISRNNPISSKGGVNKNEPSALAKFRSRFELILYDDPSELESILARNGIDFLYAIKKGVRDGIESNKVRTGIHAVFQHYEPHGDIYAYVSEWLSQKMTDGQAPFVPHMIHLPAIDTDLRTELRIPQDATVIGQYGGRSSFNIDFAEQAVVEFAARHPDCYFLFMNTRDFRSKATRIMHALAQTIGKGRHVNLRFLPGTSDVVYKTRFINTCDAMLHARLRGETFGMAIGEFSIKNKPVITFGGKGQSEFERMHLDILGEKALVYDTQKELIDLLSNIRKHRTEIKSDSWDAYSNAYAPEVVMNQFKNIFLGA